jgi:large subunit ribosomal protein L23
MISEERLLKVLLAPHVSEKATLAAETNNTVVLKVVKDANKEEIKAAVEKLFEVEVGSYPKR